MKNQSYTYSEIINQINCWKKAYADILDGKATFELDIFADKYDELIFYGCGTSYNLSQSASFYTRFLNNIHCLPLPSSELLVNTDVYINKHRKYLLVGFSRSGETTESIDVVKKLKDKKNIKFLTFTCKENSTILNYSDNNFICRDVVEKSIVMTASFSTMLFSYCLMLAKFLNNKEMQAEYVNLIDYSDKNINRVYTDLEEYVDKNNFSSYFVLGSGFNYGLAQEADLKMKEMSQTPSYFYHLYEFNHGPKSLVTENSLSLILTLSKNMFKAEQIVDEILNLGSKVLIVGKKNTGICETRNLSYLLSDANFKSDIVESFINIYVFQILAYLKTIKEKLNPDKPKNLDYTVKI